MNRFRCQYQKGEEICVSECIESTNPITSAEILLALASLAVKVKKEHGKKKGEKVALQVLKIHEHIIRDIHRLKCFGNGASKSYYLDKRNKNKDKRSERVDVEFYGEYGAEDNKHVLTEYINRYRSMKEWF